MNKLKMFYIPILAILISLVINIIPVNTAFAAYPTPAMITQIKKDCAQQQNPAECTKHGLVGLGKNARAHAALIAQQASSAVFNGYGMLGSIQTAIITAGPKLAGRLHNISGQIFGILTVLAFIWLMMPMWFKDMDWGAIVMFWVKVLIIYGMLREYNYFWNEGIVGFFIYLTKTLTGGENLLPVLVNNFVSVLNDMQLQVGGGWWATIMGALNGKILLLGIEEIIVAISFLVSIGTVF